MGTIELTVRGVTHEVPLAATTLLGRHALCLWPLGPPLFREPDRNVPAFWLELRWFDGAAAWGARSLAARGETAGIVPGRVLPEDWGSLGPRETVTAPGGATVVRLLSDEPPGLLLTDPTTGTWTEGEAACEWVEPVAAGWAPAGEAGPILRDGQCFVSAGRVWRFHLPATPSATARGELDVANPRFRLETSTRGGKLFARFVQGRVVLEIPDRFAPILAAYAEAVVLGRDFVALADVEQRLRDWKQSIDGPTIRKYRSGLALWMIQQRVAHADSLFETGRGRGAQARLTLPRDRVTAPAR